MFDALTSLRSDAPVAGLAPHAGRRRAGVVVIPACNEAARIAACLEALHPQAVPGDCAIVVVVNGTGDDTARIARRILEPRAAGSVIDLGPAPLSGGVGRARALGFAVAQRRYGPAALLTTDADCLASPDWLSRNLAALEEADIVFGRVRPMVDELAQLAPFLRRHGDVEDLYMQTAVRLAARLDPRAHDPDPAHHTASGASLAFRAGVLATIGGFPALPVNEDRAFARAVEHHDLRARYCAKACVQASCRLQGRAAGGMADTLRARCATEDPLCDAWLEPAEAFVRRHGLRGRLRRVWSDSVELARVLLAEGLHPAGAALHWTPRFGAFWAELEARLPELARRRLRHSEAARELPRLQAFLAQAERAMQTGACREMRTGRTSASASGRSVA